MGKKLTPAQAWEKIRHYCAWQERCHYEVKEKLASFGVFGQDAEIILSRLIEENFLNEERFAVQFAGGHFRMRQWGRVKIKYALKQKRLSTWCINNAMAEIPEVDYMKTLEKLAAAKWKSLAGDLPPSRWAKTRDYLIRKGYETSLVQQWLQSNTKKGKS